MATIQAFSNTAQDTRRPLSGRGFFSRSSIFGVFFWVNIIFSESFRRRRIAVTMKHNPRLPMERIRYNAGHLQKEKVGTIERDREQNRGEVGELQKYEPCGIQGYSLWNPTHSDKGTDTHKLRIMQTPPPRTHKIT